MLLKNIISYLIGISILVILFFWIDKNSLRLLLEADLATIIISIFFALILYLFSGIELYFIRRQFGVSLGLRDIILLPIVSNLWSFLFPFQGNLLFTTLFFKQRYNMFVSESFSISVYLYLVTLSFAGIFGLIFACLNKMLFSWLGLFSLMFLLNPAFIFLLNRIFKMFKHAHYLPILKIQAFLSSVIDNTRKLWQDASFTLIILIINILRIIVNISWFYWISNSLGLGLSVVTISLISLIMSISVIIKVTPGNLGVAQLITGGFVGMMGIQPDKAVLITLFATATTMLLIFTVGFYGNYHYFQTLEFSSLLRKNKNV